MSNSQEARDSVSVAFEIMDGELEIEIERLNSEGAKAFRQSLYEQAQGLTKKGLALQDFRNRVQILAEEWRMAFANEFPEPPSGQHIDQKVREIESHSKGSKTGLLVRFPDGAVICEKTAANTLIKALKKIGFDQVERLKVRINRTHLVSRSKPPSEYNAQRIDGFYIMTHSSTDQKRRHL